MGKIFKALQKSKKERRSAGSKPKSVRGDRRKIVGKEQKITVARQEMKRTDIDQPASDTSKINLGAIHNLLEEDISKPDVPESHESGVEAKEQMAQESADKSMSSVQELREDTTQVSSTSAKESDTARVETMPEQIGEDLSTIHELIDDHKRVDAKTIVHSEEIQKKKKVSISVDSQFVSKKEQVDKKTKKQVAPVEKKVIPMNKNRVIEPADHGTTTLADDATRDNDRPPTSALSKYKPGQVDHNLVALLKPESFAAEQFRMLRSNLMFPLEGKPPRTILVTSAFPGEGKSFVSTNLAITFSLDIQTHVLLIDCDVRRPSIHKLFGYHHVYGLSEYLRGKMEVPSILLNTNLSKLKIIPGGRPPKNPSELLSSKRMSNLLEEVKSKYPDRYIIIDSPPPKLTAETNVLSRQVDGIILVAKYGRTRREDFEEVIEKFDKKKILGIVINWYNLRASRYHGYGRYGGYKYYYGEKK